MPHITFIHGIANKPKADKLLINEGIWIKSIIDVVDKDLSEMSC